MGVEMELVVSFGRQEQGFCETFSLIGVGSYTDAAVDQN